MRTTVSLAPGVLVASLAPGALVACLALGCAGSPTIRHDPLGASGDAGAPEDASDAATSVVDAGGPDDGSAPTVDSSPGHDAPSPPSTLAPGTSTLSLTVAGVSRTAILYVPSSATSTAPLVIALHGDGDTDTNFIATSGLSGLADSDGFVLVAPQGITRDVHAFGETIPGVDWDAYNSLADGNIDLPLLEQLRTQIQATGQVDPNRSFVFGYSQGGYLSFFYGLSYAPVLSCAGVLAASSPFGGGSGDPVIAGAARKIAVALQIGTLDGAYGAAETTASTLEADGFPTQFNAIAGAGHVPIPGDISVPLGYCLGQTL